jgi:hypothetical protein
VLMEKASVDPLLVRKDLCANGYMLAVTVITDKSEIYFACAYQRGCLMLKLYSAVILKTFFK